MNAISSPEPSKSGILFHSFGWLVELFQNIRRQTPLFCSCFSSPPYISIQIYMYMLSCVCLCVCARVRARTCPSHCEQVCACVIAYVMV